MDKRQVEHLFRQGYKSMYATAYGLLYDEQEAKDVVSSIFVDLLGKDLLLKDETCEQYLLGHTSSLLEHHSRQEQPAADSPSICHGFSGKRRQYGGREA